MRRLALVFLLACDDPKPAANADASVDAPPPAPAPVRAAEGCLRSGSLEAIENDPTCVLLTVKDDVMRDIERRVSLSAELEPSTVIAGSSAVLRVTITNVASSETLVVFDAYPRGQGLRPDWSRLAGVPDVKGDMPDVPRLQVVVSTLDARGERPVDELPVVANSAAGASTPRILGVRLRPGAKLVATTTWHALRIPAPAPMFKDDAGHRFVPKTTAVPLHPGDYTVSIDLPLHGLAPAERTVTARAKVEKPTPADR